MRSRRSDGRRSELGCTKEDDDKVQRRKKKKEREAMVLSRPSNGMS
jgi:hypothetical protein